KQGATPGATVAFLVATPETGADSISLTYALTDPVMTVFRPIAGVAAAISAGLATNFFGVPRPRPGGTPLPPQSADLQLDRVLALNAGGRFFDVVLDVLREIEVDAGKFRRQRVVDLLRQLLLIDAFGPGIERLQRHVEFEIEEPGRVGSVIGPAELREDRHHLGEAPDDLPHLIGVRACFLERDRRRQCGADPQIAFLERRQKFKPERLHAEHRESQENNGAAERQNAVGDSEIENRFVNAAQTAHYQRFGLAHLLR